VRKPRRIEPEADEVKTLPVVRPDVRCPLYPLPALLLAVMLVGWLCVLPLRGLFRWDSAP